MTTQHYLYKLSQAAELLNLSERTVRRLVKEGEIKTRFVGRVLRIHRDEIERFAKGEPTEAVEGNQ